jgi:large subunit ribosomal protein L9
MKVILTRDVPKLGDMGTIQDVKNGFARNFLIPQGLAVVATSGMVKQVEERQAAEERRIAALEEEMRELSEQIDGMRIEIHARVGEQGRLYGSVTSGDIAEQLSAAVDNEIDRRTIEMDGPIREIGEFEVPIRLVGRLIPKITVEVYDPDQPMTRAAARAEAEAAEAAAAEAEAAEAEAFAAEAEAAESAASEATDPDAAGEPVEAEPTAEAADDEVEEADADEAEEEADEETS